MSLLNYSTGIEAAKTVANIQSLLAKNGATAILSEYDDQGYITALSFKINVNSQVFAIKLPSDWRPVLEVLKQQKVKNRRIVCTQDQALKVSWRIVEDWIEAQMAILQTKMVKIEQIFLPYIITDNNQTLYERFNSNPQLLLK